MPVIQVSWKTVTARRVFVDRIEDDRAVVAGDRAHHLSRVVRLRPGEIVEVSDFRRVFRAKVGRVTADSVSFELLEEAQPPELGTSIKLWMAIVKFPRFEWALEKATEIGAVTIGALAAERSDAKLVQATPKRMDRWRRLAEEAAQQSRRLAPPEIVGPSRLSEIEPQGQRLFLDFDAPPLKETLDPRPEATLAVGPEGGWSDDERARAIAAGWRPARLGKTVLRSETAAVAGLATLSHLLGA